MGWLVAMFDAVLLSHTFFKFVTCLVGTLMVVYHKSRVALV